MCLRLVSKQPPAQSLEEINKESCYRALMRWVDGGMSVVVPLVLEIIISEIAFRAVLNFSWISGCLNCQPWCWSNYSQASWSGVLFLSLFCFKSMMDFIPKGVFFQNKTTQIVYCCQCVICHIGAKLIWHIFQQERSPWVESYWTFVSNWPVFHNLFPLCLPLFFTHSPSDSTQIPTHKYTCMPARVTEIQKGLVDEIQWKGLQPDPGGMKKTSVWYQLKMNMSPINLNSDCRYAFSVSYVWSFLTHLSIKHQVTAAVSPIQSGCSQGVYPGFPYLLSYHYSYLC